MGNDVVKALVLQKLNYTEGSDFLFYGFFVVTSLTIMLFPTMTKPKSGLSDSAGRAALRHNRLLDHMCVSDHVAYSKQEEPNQLFLVVPVLTNDANNCTIKATAITLFVSSFIKY